MAVDFTPTLVGYSNQEKLRFWCQKVLPLVYDDSLSYYELLNKVVLYLNNAIQDVANAETNIDSLFESYQELQDYVNSFGDEISAINDNVAAALQAKTDAESAKADAETAKADAEAAKDDAEAAVEQIGQLSETIENNVEAASDLLDNILEPVTITETAGYFGGGGEINPAGASTQEVYTNQISVLPNYIVHFEQHMQTYRNLWVAVALYDEQGNFIRRDTLVSASLQDYITDYVVPENCYKVAFTYRTYGISTVSISINAISKKESIEDALNKYEELLNKIKEVSTDESGNVPIDDLTSGYITTDGSKLTLNSANYSVTNKYDGYNLKQGDIIRNSNKDTYAIFGCYTTDGTTYTTIAETNEPYIVPVDGIYYINFRYRGTSTAISNVDEFMKNFEIFRPSTREDYGDIKTVFDEYEMKSISHRGWNSDYPENTLIAFIKSATLGFDIVECDLRFTSDNVPVLLHDKTINRTARNADGSTINETIYIQDITYQQALTYDFGIWQGEQFAGQKIPTLAQAVECWKKCGLKAYVEIHQDLWIDQIPIAYSVVKNADYEKFITWISFSYLQLVHVIFENKYNRVGLICNTLTNDDIIHLQTIKTKFNDVFINLDERTYTTYLTLAVDNHENVELWTVDTLNNILNVNPYISGITSNVYNAQAELKKSLTDTLPT